MSPLSDHQILQFIQPHTPPTSVVYFRERLLAFNAIASGAKHDVANAVAGVAYLLRAAAPMTFAPPIVITRRRISPYEPYGITPEDGTYHG